MMGEITQEQKHLYFNSPSFRAITDYMTSLVLNGDISPDELQVALKISLEKVERHKKINPNWKPMTQEERNIETKARILKLTEQFFRDSGFRPPTTHNAEGE